MSLFATLKIIDMTMETKNDVIYDVTSAFKASARKLYDDGCVEFGVFDANIADISDGNEHMGLVTKDHYKYTCSV